MSERRLGERVAVVATAAAVISMVALTVVALVGGVGGGGGRGGGGGGGNIAAFNSCIRQTRFLVLAHHGPGNGVIETIKDGARRTVEGEVASGRAPAILPGAAAGNGPYVMSTATPLGRDASAIELCWDRFFPVAPGA